jgi:predicted O-methyltransferase YrrM
MILKALLRPLLVRKVIHTKQQRIKRVIKSVFGTHVLSLFHNLQIAVTMSKLRIMGDSVEPTLSYMKRNDVANPLHIAPRRLRLSFLSFFPILVAQSTEAFKVFLNLLRHFRPRAILEIGTALGGTLLMFTKVASDDALIITLDVDRSEWRREMYRRFARRDQVILSLKVDSHDPQVPEDLAWTKFDLLFIDGDHNYEGVKRDFHMYRKLVRRGGLIAFHDLYKEGVQRLWNQVKRSYGHLEIYAAHRFNGIPEMGILFV